MPSGRLAAPALMHIPNPDGVSPATRVRGMNVVVVGAGALGNEVVKALALLEVGRIRVVDPDIVEPGNLTRSLFFRCQDYTGQNKAEALCHAAAVLFPDTCFFASPHEVADVGLSALAGTDVLFGCVDSDLARLEIAYLSTRLGIPVADGGLGIHRVSHGRATWFPGVDGACYGCKLPANRRRELLTLWQASPQSCRVPRENIDVPSTPTMSAIIGSLQVELGLRHCLAGTTISESVEISLEGIPQLQVILNPQASECPFHEAPKELRTLAGNGSTAEALLAKAGYRNTPNAYVRLDWPVCTWVRCGSCGHAWSPMLRAGFLNRYSACPACCAKEIVILQSVQTIQQGDAWAARPLSEFGILPGQSVAVRLG